MDARNNDFDFDFTPIGQAIKKARTSQGMTREQLARIVDYDPRHLQAIENEGQYPSLELFIQLVTMFNISPIWEYPVSCLALLPHGFRPSEKGHRMRSARFWFLCFSPISATSFPNCS